MERPYRKLTITEKGADALRQGHVWVYAGEVTGGESGCAGGEVVDVHTAKGRWQGAGFYNPSSLIRVRILTRNTNDRIDENFFRRRVSYALAYRRQVMGEDFSCCRLIFGEADGFPGLTVDRFGDVLVTEVLCLGIEQRKETIYRLLLEELEKLGVRIRVLYERNESPLRTKEGMPCGKGPWLGEGLESDPSGHVEIRENGVTYEVDYADGQKTGFFLDQKYNRRAAASLAPGRKVLDCFTHTGAFALNCAIAGAASVTAVDVSADALEQAAKNAALSGLEGKVEFLQADVFDLLTEMAKKGGFPYDYVILDPPAFTKSSATVKKAYAGYKEINLKAMKLLPRGGYLATCSCSHFMTEPMFRKMLAEAAADAGVTLKQIEARQQAPDHPILWGVPETNYLKFFLFQVC